MTEDARQAEHVEAVLRRMNRVGVTEAVRVDVRCDADDPAKIA